MNKALTIYTKNGCIQCKMTKRFLTEHNIAFEEHNINNQPQYLDYLKQRGFQSVPVVMSQTATVVGFRPDALKELAQ